MPNCFVPGCGSKSKKQEDKVTLHCFPRQKASIAIWLRFCGIAEEDIGSRTEDVLDDAKSYRYRMCSLHFTYDQHESTSKDGGRFKKGRLRFGSVPSINPACVGTNEETESSSAMPMLIEPIARKCMASQTTSTCMSTAEAGCQATVTYADKSCQINFEDLLSDSQKDGFAQWPEYEQNFSGEHWKVAKDHSYHSQTPEELPSLSTHHVCESTPKKGPLQQLFTHFQSDPMQLEWSIDTMEETIGHEVESDASSETMDDSCQTTFDDKKNDPDFSECSRPEDDSFIEAEFNELHEIVCEKKYLVFRSCLLALFRMLTCSFMSKDDKKCGKPLTNLETFEYGSCFEVKACCFHNHPPIHWRSQPMIGKVSAGNLMIGSSILFSGLTFEKVSTFAGFLGLEFIGSSTFYKYQRMYLYPTIHEAWQHEQMNLEILLSGAKLRISGDGQCDSPGFSAKYCVYTIMDQMSGKILCVVVVQVTECTSSVAMEKLALQKALANLTQRGFEIDVLTTDRHVSIAKLMREQYKHINHQFDVWHFAKSLKKKVNEASKKKGCSDLAGWSQSITNHLWWSSRTCENSMQLLVEKWMSLLSHTTNKHHWIGYTEFHECEHDPIPEDAQRRKKWLQPETPAHDALVRIVCDKTFKRDLNGLTEFTHTGPLEVFHSNVLKYRPKQYHFGIDGMEARTILAALAHNENTERSQARKKCGHSEDGEEGELRFKVECPKGRNEWIAKKVFEGMQYGHVYDMMMHVLEMKKSGLHTVWQSRKDDMPRNIARLDKPLKAEIVARMSTRF